MAPCGKNLHRSQAKPYHIDYVFASRIFSDRLTKFEIGHVENWLKISDHLPLVCEFE
jgi:endonuclease/exonuclease/phosphatase family metal-dependent hydrolase